MPSPGVARDFGRSVPLRQQPAGALEAIIEEDLPLAAAEGSIARLQAVRLRTGGEVKGSALAAGAPVSRVTIKSVVSGREET